MNFSQSNPFQAPQTSIQAAAAFAEESERIGFIRRTYLHLAAAVLGFVAIEYVIFTALPQETIVSIVSTLTQGYAWLLVLGGFMVVGWVARSWAESGGSQAKQYLGLALYVAFQAVVFMPILFIAQVQVGGQVIQSAGVVTLVVFGGLTAFVLVSKADFSFMRVFLFWGGMVAMGLVVCALVFSFNLGVIFSVAMIALASGYILYDTSNVLHHYRTDQYVAASLALFASVAILFFYILRLLMALSSRD